MKNNEWYSASELIGLPDLPGSVQWINALACKEGWRSRPRAGRGGGREYHVGSLPAAARAALSARLYRASVSAGQADGRRLQVAAAIDERVMQRQRETGLAEAAHLTGRQRERMDAKLYLLAELDAFGRHAHLPDTVAINTFCARYNMGDIEVEPWVRAHVPHVHYATVYNWRRHLAAGGAARLAGEYGNRRGSSKIDTQPELREFVLAMLTDFPHASAAHVMAALRARFGGRDDVTLPGKRSVERWLAGYKRDNKQLFAAVSNPDQWKSHYMAAYGSASEDVVRLNQRWELDSTPGDVELVDGRYTILGVIDIYPRRAKLLLARTSKSDAVALLTRRALLEWGVPEEVKTDNGADYKSLHVRRVFASLDVHQEFCDPFAAWQKPHIERLFRTMSHDLVELLPNYIGHSVADRKALEARRSFADRLLAKDKVLPVQMAADELQRFLDDWVEHIYHRNPHSSLRDKTPFEMVSGWTGQVRRIDSERALDVLLAEAPGNGVRTVTKHGIRVDRNTYVAPELGEYVGQQVQVRYAEDVGRIYVFDDGGFVCIAEDPSITGVSRREVAAHAREKQKTAMQEARRELKRSARKANTRDIAEEILAARAQENNTVAFPTPSVPHTSEGLAAADQAARAVTGQTEKRDLTEREEAIARQLKTPAAPVHQLPETPKQRYQRWLAIDRRIQAGEAVSEADRGFWQGYQQTADWRAQERLQREYGLGQETQGA